MALTLQWRNDNTQDYTTRLYRATSPIDKTKLPAPIATLPKGVNSYVDNNVLFNVRYYYMLEVVGANDSMFSLNQPVDVTDRRGAGPNILKYGDDNYGYFGKVTPLDFFNAADVGKAGRNGGISVSNAVTWHKFARNGKTLFVPDQRLGSTYNYVTLYAAGLAQGVDSVGQTPSGYTPTNQKITMSKDGDTYLVRLPRGYNDANAALQWDGSTYSSDGSTLPFSEIEDLLYPIVNVCPLRQRMVNVDNASPFNYVQTGSSAYSGYGILCAELNPTKAGALIRQRGNFSGALTRADMAIGQSQPVGSGSAWWVPVLELIDPVQTLTL